MPSIALEMSKTHEESVLEAKGQILKEINDNISAIVIHC